MAAGIGKGFSKAIRKLTKPPKVKSKKKQLDCKFVSPAFTLIIFLTMA